MRRSSRIGGYTLIEVLVAFMILALALTVLLRIFSGGLRNVAASADYAHAILVAEAQLATAGVTDALVPGETYGDEGGKFRWRKIVRTYLPFAEYDPGTLPVTAYHITVIVEWSHAGSVRQVDLRSIRLARAAGAP